MLRRLCRLMYTRWYWITMFTVFNGTLFFGGLESKWMLVIIGWVLVSIAIKGYFVARELRRRR